MAEQRTSWEQNGYNDNEQNQMTGLFVMLALVVSVALGLLLMQQARPKRKPGLAGEIEERVGMVEKELSRLSKRLQDRIKDLT